MERTLTLLAIWVKVKASEKEYETKRQNLLKRKGTVEKLEGT